MTLPGRFGCTGHTPSQCRRLAYLQETQPPSALIELNEKCKPSTFSNTGKLLGQGEDTGDGYGWFIFFWGVDFLELPFHGYLPRMRGTEETQVVPCWEAPGAYAKIYKVERIKGGTASKWKGHLDDCTGR